jgi:hypothetical protein
MSAVLLLSVKSEKILIGQQTINLLLHMLHAYEGIRVV